VTVVACLVALLACARVVRLQRRLELVARAEHELRGPLTALVMAAERGRAPGAELDRVRLGLEDLAAARSGRRSPATPELVDLFELTRSAARGAAAVDWGAGRTVVRTDRRRLSQALGNLLANAAEHGRGPVVVRGRRSGERVRIEVVDRGPGIEPGRRRRRGARGLIVAEAAAEDAGARLEASGHPVIDIPITRS
jgi:signal transduction histidine kinase